MMAGVRGARRVFGAGLLLVLALWFCSRRSRDEEAPAPPKQRVVQRLTRQASVPRPPSPRAARLAQRGLAERIAGIVTTADGAPVRGARVRLANAVVRARLLDEPTVLTDDAGRFDLGRHPMTRYLVSAESAGLTTAMTWIDTSSPSDDLHLVLQPCVASIHGTIRDAAGGVVSSARVTRSDGVISTSSGVDADARGAYELCVPPGPTAVEISADGYASIVTQVNVFGRTRRDFELVPGATVSGRVVRAADQEPVADALVEMTDGEVVVLRARSDDEGRFEIDGAMPGRYQLTATADGLTSDRPVEVDAEVGMPGSEVVCALVAGFVVGGKIVEQGSDEPIEGIGVVLVSSDAERTPSSSTTRTDGTFVVEHVVPGAYTVEVAGAATHEERHVTVVAVDVEGLVIEVARGARITGRVLHGGKPVAGALVRVEGGPDAGHSDADGRFTIPYVPAGDHQLYAESLRDGAFTRTALFTLVPGEDKDVDLELDLEGSIAGVVVDERGAPVPDVFVKCSLIGGDDMGMATTATDGSFTAQGLSGGGDYECVVRQHDGSALVFAPASGAASFPPVSIVDGKTHVAGVRLSIRNERYAISGRVLGEDGTPQADVRVAATSDTLEQDVVTSTDAHGAFTLRDLSAGTYALVARSSRGEAMEADVAAGRTDVVLRTNTLTTITGVLVGFTSTSELVVQDDDGLFEVKPTGTTFTLHGIPTGTYEITATSATELGSARVTAATSEPVAVTVTKQPVGAVEGIVRDVGGAPLEGITCASLSGRNTATTDTRGTFRLEPVRAGTNQIVCDKPVRAGTVVVTANQTARIELVAPNHPAPDDE